MTSTKVELIRKRRKVLGNQYAYLDELEELSEVRADRKRLEDPYAHIDILENSQLQVARFDSIAAPAVLQVDHRHSYTDEQLEKIVRDIQVELLKAARAQDPEVDPIAVLDPAKGLRLFGFGFAVVDSLDDYGTPGWRGSVAGVIDQESKFVKVSGQYSRAIRNFTAAHEFGHAVLHETHGLHRDLPMSGVRPTKDRAEYEADRFAAFFLMPGKLLKTRFESVFGSAPFKLTHSTAAELFSQGEQGRLRKGIPVREVSRKLASLSRYFGLQVSPLTEQFGVSEEAMAIRIEELGLIWIPGEAADVN